MREIELDPWSKPGHLKLLEGTYLYEASVLGPVHFQFISDWGTEIYSVDRSLDNASIILIRMADGYTLSFRNAKILFKEL